MTESPPNQEPGSQPWETMQQAVVIFRDRTLLHSLTQVPTLSEDVLAAMQRLVELVRTLRSPEQGWNGNHPPTPEALIPYTSDEVHDLLDLLHQNPLCQAPPDPTRSPPVLVETLIPELLWSVARSAYPTMQWIEGVRAQVSQPDDSWAAGILRLAILLEIKTEAAVWELDLAMGHPPQQFVDENCCVQLEEDWFWQHSSDLEGFGEPGDNHPSTWLTTQLQTLTEALISTTPVLQSWLQGLPVELMLPGNNWQTGELRLKLGFEFIPYKLGDLPSTTVAAFAPAIDAELLDESGGGIELDRSVSPFSGVEQPPLTPVAVVEMPLPALMATTIVRLADPDTQETLARLATQQELAKSVNRLHLLQPMQSEEGVAQIIRQAYCLSELTYHAASSSFSLLQPELLIDELLPKLLWHISRSSYLGMQWLGGVPATVLQPKAAWETGTLRLVVILELRTADERSLIDLAAGRFVEHERSAIDATAIARIHDSSVFPKPIEIQSLQAQLLQTIQTTAPEITLLMQGVAIEWLTQTHDWNLGTLTLHANLEFCSDLFG